MVIQLTGGAQPGRLRQGGGGLRAVRDQEDSENVTPAAVGWSRSMVRTVTGSVPSIAASTAASTSGWTSATVTSRPRTPPVPPSS